MLLLYTDQFVIPGNIIFKQRGTIWHAGENALRGRDHTIHAAATGYVKYYRDPSVHPNRQFIGVAFNKEDILPYPKKEPRRRKLGLVAHVRKTSNTPRAEISDSGIPTKVLRKAGLWNLEALERRLWNADQRRELREAKAQRKREAKEARAGLPLKPKEDEKAVSSAEATTVTNAPAASVAESSGLTSPELFTVGAGQPTSTAVAGTSGSTSPDTFAVSAATSSVPTRITINSSAKETKTPAPKMPYQKERTRPVTPGEFLQKSWHERRHTKVLLLNPRSYAYTESNAAIGRLSSKTMYTPPWKLGGRKSRFRSRRRRVVAALAKAKADKALVRREKEKERLAEEKKKAARLEKQRAKSAKRAEAAAAAGGKAEASSVSEVPVVAKAETGPSVEVKDAAKPVVEAAEKPVAVKESERPAEPKQKGEKPTES